MVTVPEPKGPLMGGPDAVLTPDCKTPPVMEVPPVYVFAADRVCVPAPDLVSAIGPAMTPL